MNYRNRNTAIILCALMMVLAFIMDPLPDIYKGMMNIIKSPDILLTDYMEVGGFGAAFLNASIMGFINLWILKKTDTEFDGLALAATLTVVGFSFIGKNVFNFWPIYLGGYFYYKIKKVAPSSVIKVLMFATTLSPIVSELTFGSQLPAPLGLITGVLLGVVIGFIIVPVSQTMFQTHKGYSLYNVGLSGGLIGTVIFSLLRSFDIIVDVQDIISTRYHMHLLVFLIVLCLLLILYGVIGLKTGWKDYKLLLEETGLEPKSFSTEEMQGAMFVNMGMVGLVSLAYVILVGSTLNGPIIAAILTVMGFAAYGKHPLNILPILVGVYIAASIKIWDVGSTHVIIASLFGTTLAPISGSFGPIAGMVAGFLHLSTVMNVGVIHGGTNLYNNGFAGGIISILMVSVLVDMNKKVKQSKQK